MFLLYVHVLVEGSLEVLLHLFKVVSLGTRIFSLIFDGLCAHVILSVQQAVFDATLIKFSFSLLTLVSFFF